MGSARSGVMLIWSEVLPAASAAGFLTVAAHALWRLGNTLPVSRSAFALAAFWASLWVFAALRRRRHPAE